MAQLSSAAYAERHLAARLGPALAELTAALEDETNDELSEAARENPLLFLSQRLRAPALHLLSAKAAVRMLKTGDVTPAQLIDVVEARLRETEPQLHATPIACFERARKAAKALIHPVDPDEGYLWGLPILVKVRGGLLAVVPLEVVLGGAADAVAAGC